MHLDYVHLTEFHVTTPVDCENHLIVAQIVKVLMVPQFLPLEDAQDYYLPIHLLQTDSSCLSHVATSSEQVLKTLVIATTDRTQIQALILFLFPLYLLLKHLE